MTNKRLTIYDLRSEFLIGNNLLPYEAIDS